MRIQAAKNYYLGRSGPRLNCAQAVLAAFEKPYKQAASCGTGNAPGGICGALWAAQQLLNTEHSDRLADLENDFLKAAGSTLCAEIRASRKLSCLGCIEKAVGFVEKIVL